MHFILCFTSCKLFSRLDFRCSLQSGFTPSGSHAVLFWSNSQTIFQINLAWVSGFLEGGGGVKGGKFLSSSHPPPLPSPLPLGRPDTQVNINRSASSPCYAVVTDFFVAMVTIGIIGRCTVRGSTVWTNSWSRNPHFSNIISIGKGRVFCLVIFTSARLPKRAPFLESTPIWRCHSW